MLLARLAVDLDYQGQGIARVLVRDAVEKAISIQAVAGVVSLITHAKNQSAEEFYLSQGFTKSPVIENLMCLHLKS